MLCAQAGLQPVRSVQALSQREDLPAHWQGAEASRKRLNLRVAMANIANYLRTFAIAVLILLSGAAFAAVEAQELSQLRNQLKTAEDAADKPAIIELSRRILAITPNDSKSGIHLRRQNWKPKTWIVWSKHSTHGKKQSGIHRQRLKISGATCRLGARIINVPSGIGLRFSRRSRRPQTPRPSTTIWRIYARRRSVGKITRVIERRQSLHRIRRTRRVARAIAFLRLHKWDAAYADMAKANKMDATDSEVKEWLPQFERLQAFLPQIKALDAQIAKSPNDAWHCCSSERAFSLWPADRCWRSMTSERALKLQPASMRARIQTGRGIARCRSRGRRGKIGSRQISSSWRGQTP